MSNMMPSNCTDRGQVLRSTESGWGGAARLWALVWAGFLVLGLLLTLGALSASAQGKTILIVAPHPDDETLCCAGVISTALASGNTVKVVVVTNGDAVGGTSTGLTREAESISAMNLLGLAESDVIFLGYGDTALKQLFDTASPTTVYTSVAGQTQTYAARGLGLVDYHMYLNGVHGSYNRATVLEDMKAAIQNIQPDEIYTTSITDKHTDHAATYSFVAEALIALQKQGLAKVPRIHETLTHEPNEGGAPYHWPDPPFTPAQPFPAIPNLDTMTEHRWNQIERIPVPPSMQDPSQTTNLKSRLISQYVSQGGNNPTSWLQSFVKKDEFFWIRDFPTNLAPLATVTVSSTLDTFADAAVKAVDQRLSGVPFPPTNPEWIAHREWNGAWIRLTWPTPVVLADIVLYDRPNLTDNILSGTLTFSDGSLPVSVGALPPGGNGHMIFIEPRTVTWVQFTIDSAQGDIGGQGGIGLSEFEAFGKPAGSAVNHAPQIFSGPTPAQEAITDEQSTTLSLTSIDVDDNDMIYAWTADAGRITGSGSAVTFNPPKVAATTVVTIAVTVSDGLGGSVVNRAFVTVSHGVSNATTISSLTLNPASVASGGASTGTVTLNAVATDGAVLTLSSSNTAAATVPATVTVAPGASTATFPVTAKFVSSSTNVTITGALGGVSQNATLTVTPPAVTLQSLTVNPTTLGGGSSATGTLTLSAAAPVGGAVISLSSGAPAVASVPATVTVLAGSTSTTFTVTTQSLQSPQTVVLSASYAGSTPTANLRVAPVVAPNLATVATVTVSSQNAADGQLGIKAIDGIVDGYPGDYTKEWVTQGQTAGAWIRMTWSSAMVVDGVTLYDRPNLTDNITSGTLSFSDGSTVAVSALPNQGLGLTVTFAPKVVTWMQFTVNTAAGLNTGLAEMAISGSMAPILSSLTLNPSSVTGGNSTTGTVTLSGAAPAGGALITLSSNKPVVSGLEGVFSAAGLPASGVVNWSSLGSLFSTVNSGAVVPVPGQSGVNMTLSTGTGLGMMLLDNCATGEACGWWGNFAPGANLLWAGGTYDGSTGWWAANGPLTVAFSSPQRGLGFQIMADENGAFTATLCAYNSLEVLLGCVPFNGNGSGAGDNSAVFIGLYDDAQEISKVTIDAGGVLYPHDFAIGSMLVTGTRRPMVPASMVVPAGSTTATFTVTPGAVSNPTSVDITGTYVVSTQSAVLVINPAVLASVSLNPTGVIGGASLTGTATLTGPAPLGGAVVMLSADNAVSSGVQAVTSISGMPQDGTVDWSQLGPQFTSVPAGTTLPIAGMPGVTVSVSTLNDDLSSMALTNCPTVDGNCGFGGNFAPADPLLWVGGAYDGQGTWTGNGPLILRLSAPQRGVGFRIMADEDGPFTGTICGYDASDTLVGCVPISGHGAFFANGTTGIANYAGIYSDAQQISAVTIDAGGALYPHDFAIGNLTVASSRRMVPSSVTLQPGATSATFPVNTDTVDSVNDVTITGDYNATHTANLTVAPYTFSGLSVSPSLVQGGNSATGTVTLTIPAPAGGAEIALSSDNPIATVPVTVTVPAGATTGTFAVATSQVTAATPVTITATYDARVSTAELTLVPPALSALSVSPSAVAGGVSSTGTVTLVNPAPAGGAVVTLSDNSPFASIPASVTIAEGATAATFPITTVAVGTSSSATISASLIASTLTANLTISAPILSSVTMSPSSVIGGSSSVGTVTLSSAAPAGGAVVTLTDNSLAALTPDNVTVLAGATTATFVVSTQQVGSVTAVTVTGSYNGTANGSLTINPPNPIRVNAGGAAFTDSLGHLWSADASFSGGSTSSVPAGTAIAGTVDDTLYQSERYGSSFTYSFTVPAGSYQVTLKFAETFFTNSVLSGQRTFNVVINGTTVLTNFDVKATAGGANIALDRAFAVTTGAGANNIQIQFIHLTGQADLPMVKAIEVVGAL